MKEIIKVYRGFCGKPERKRNLGSPRLRREDIKCVLQKRDEKAWTRFIWLIIHKVVGY
jgi:hypothetical protein